MYYNPKLYTLILNIISNYELSNLILIFRIQLKSLISLSRAHRIQV